MEDNNTYTYAAEVAVAVGGTLLVWFFCNNKKTDADKRMIATADDTADLKDDEDKQEDTLKMGATTRTDKDKTNDGGKQLSSEDNINPNDTVDSDAMGSAKENRREVNEGRIIATSDKATQTKDECNESHSTNPTIVWQAVLVNDPAMQQARYRTELHVDIDGVISHSESIYKEGFAGKGMKQVLVKVQS